MDQLPPPPWESVITTALIVVSILFPIISAISILFRVLARRKSSQALHSDDYWIFASWFLSLALSILVWVYAGKSGINYYNVDFLTGTEASLELVFISSCFVQFPLAAVKIGVLLFYKRIFTTPWFKRCVWAVIGIVSVWCILFFLVVLLEIDPIAFPLMQTRLKYDSAAVGLGQVASSFTLDLIVLCMPLPVISRLNMNRERKIALVLIFWLGAFCAVAAIVRTALLKISIDEVVENKSNVASQSTQYIFMILEPNCSILAACLPTYGPLFRSRGGRAPESLVRSVRSIFSLRSAAGSSTGGVSRKNYNNLSGSNLPRGSGSGAVSATESQVELQGVTIVKYVRPEEDMNIKGAIAVTNEYGVRRE